jgi:hypothetical protein
MIASFVGILTRRGLEAFFPETEHASRFMQRRLRRCRQVQACGVWFVLDGGVAEIVGELVASDEGGAAWAIVEHQARDGGILVPERPTWADFKQDL